MNKKEKTGLVIIAAILLIFVFIYTHKPGESPIPPTSEDIKRATSDMRKALKPYPGMEQVKNIKHISSSEVPNHSIAPENIFRGVTGLVNDLTDPELSKVERNRIEHMLGSNPDKDIDKKIRLMLEDGLLDLSEKSRSGMARFMSAIRIAGLRSDKKSVECIIHICTHPETNEDLQALGYEALGYIKDETANDFLRNELPFCQDGFLRSQIVLSLGTAQDRKCSQQFLSYLDHPDPDLRDSAIISLGKIREVRAVPKFKEIYEKAAESSKILIVQALKDIESSDATNLLNEITKGAKNLPNTTDKYLISRLRSCE